MESPCQFAPSLLATLKFLTATLVALLTFLAPSGSATTDVLTSDPGSAAAAISGNHFSLENRALSVEWTIDSGKLKFTKFRDILGNEMLVAPAELFVIHLKDERDLPASQMSVLSAPEIESLPASPDASRESDRLQGKKITVSLQAAPNLNIIWSAVLRDGSNYLRQEVTLKPSAMTFRSPTCD